MGHGNFFEDGDSSEPDEPLRINDLKDEAIKAGIEKFGISTRRKRDLGNGKWCCIISSASIVYDPF